ncbi:transcriptional regulator [Bradyrhizobium ontarionense]|uniref:Transcriptional regulator n=1 Tax=Bradyrhizobium ontarionense TaxID=2898149 RepID=A0ABY3RFH8_9BRAD|nr:transcriptional regulator [Bradyrhizobium sp. A19]UFZ05478.1 transcriptional regulator [Bradyrhizobium sp. A19]
MNGQSYHAKAKTAWGDALPDWVQALAEEADRTNARRVAERIGYSNAVVSYVIANKYPGDVERVAEKVRGALLGAKVMCPVMGEMDRDYCLDQQKIGDTGASSVRARLYRHCRGLGGVEKCPNSRIPEGQR